MQLVFEFEAGGCDTGSVQGVIRRKSKNTYGKPSGKMMTVVTGFQKLDDFFHISLFLGINIAIFVHKTG